MQARALSRLRCYYSKGVNSLFYVDTVVVVAVVAAAAVVLVADAVVDGTQEPLLLLLLCWLRLALWVLLQATSSRC